MDRIFEVTLDVIERTLRFKNADITLKEGNKLRVKAYRGYKQSKHDLFTLPLHDKKITVEVVNMG